MSRCTSSSWSHDSSTRARTAKDVTQVTAAPEEDQAPAVAVAAESELPEIQAWRRAFAQLGLKPTQYRCASESLLRRFRKEGRLPALHPLVDLCNAVSLAFAVPVAVLDVAQITGPLKVRYATGTETYLTFASETEHPAEGEVIFADQAGHAHARRWTNRQSGGPQLTGARPPSRQSGSRPRCAIRPGRPARSRTTARRISRTPRPRSRRPAAAGSRP